MHPRWKVTMERYQEVMVALSECVMKNRLKRSMAANSRWHHIRLAIKPRYLGNHAYLIKSYYWSLSGSHDRSFRIRHEKLREASPGGELTMMSCPIGNKTSLSRKSGIANKMLLWITFMKSCSLSNFYKKNSKFYFKKLINITEAMTLSHSLLVLTPGERNYTKK